MLKSIRIELSFSLSDGNLEERKEKVSALDSLQGKSGLFPNLYFISAKREINKWLGARFIVPASFAFVQQAHDKRPGQYNNTL